MVDRILKLMKEKNLTAAQFADEIGIQRSGMSHLVSGRNKPSLDLVMKVLNRFPDVSPEYLLHGTEDQPARIMTEDPAPGPVPALPTLPATATLFDQVAEEAPKPESRPQKTVRKEKSEKRIEKIVVFYDDRTFREYLPEPGKDQ